MARYQELLEQLPTGSAYANSGYVLPFRDDPQEFLFEDASFPNQVYGVFVDDRFFGTVTSDAQGSVIVAVELDPGPHEVAVENDQTARRLRSYVTVRDYAVWYASYAEALEGDSTFFGIDPAIDSVEAAPPVLTADSIHIEDVHGQPLRQPNDLGYITDSYRTVLQGLRQAFRLYAATPFGIAETVASYTNSLAFVVPRALRPTWFLNSQFAPNGTLDQRTHVAQSALPNLNEATLTAVGQVDAPDPNDPTPVNPPTTQTLLVVFDATWDGGNITVTGTDASNAVISEVFTPVGPAVGGFITKSGSEPFQTVTAIDNSVLGTTGTARVGLTSEAFVRVVEVQGSPIQEGLTAAATTYLTVNNNGGVLSFSYGSTSGGNNDNRVEIGGNGRYELPYEAEGDLLIGAPEPGGGWDFGGPERERDRLYLNIGDRGRIEVLLGVSAGLTGNTAADVVTDINTALVADGRYGVGAATVEPSASNLLGDAINIDSSLLPISGLTQQSFVRVELGCADAAREVLGLPRYVGDSINIGVVSATTITYGATDRIGDLEAPFEARVGRGLFSAGIGVVSNASGRFADFTGAAATDLRVGDCIRLLSTTGGNAGLHLITEVLGADSWRIRHEDVGGSFTNVGGQGYTAWIQGDLVSVTDNNTAANTLTIAGPGLERAYPTGYQVELAQEVPFQTDEDHRKAPSTLVVDVDVSLAPTVPLASFVEDDLGLAGQLTPDGWLINNATAEAIRPRGFISESSIGLERDGADIEFQAEVPRVVPDLEGFPIRVSFWVHQHNTATQNFRIDVSWDGTTFDSGPTVAVPGTLEFDGADRRTRPDPRLVQRVVTPPFDATTMLVRLVHEGAGSDRITIERVLITSDVTSGYFLGDNTIVRCAQVSAFGEIIYVWSPEELTPEEDLTIGIDPSGAPRPSDTDNKIDLVSSAHGTNERFDISEYDVNGDPLNVLGAYDDVGWLASTLTNMEVIVGVPGRFSYVRPTVLSLITGEALTPDAFGVATTAQPTTHLGPFPEAPNGSFRLLEDGVPVPDTADASAILPYTFTAGDTLDIDASVFVPAATYTANYDVLVSAETAVIDLGADAADYFWIVDAYVWQAIDQTVGMRTRTQSVTFLADFNASLDVPADADQNTATLTADNGISVTTVADANWSFVDQSTVSINPSVFDANSLYTLEYASVFSRFERQPRFTLELRSAATAPDVLTATYATVEINDPVDNTLQFHQLRLQLYDVTNTDDVRVHSLGVRGIRAFGATPNAPGIVLP